MTNPVLDYFLKARRDVVALETVDIAHSAFSQRYRKVRNHPQDDGVTVKLETGATARFDYLPMNITELDHSANLDTGFRIEFGDLGETLPRELDAVYDADAMGEKPTIIYRAYRSDDLEHPLIGPLYLQANSFSFTREGASFEAAAPYVNNTTTGETYNLTRFFMLRGIAK